MNYNSNSADYIFKYLGVFLVCLGTTQTTRSQGFSINEYYPHQEYGAHVQNWTAERDSNDFIYFGNGSGLLTFDGVNWNFTHIGETGRGTSIFQSSTGKIYASGLIDFGFIKPDSISSIGYESISDDFYSENERVATNFETYEWQGNIFYRHFWGVNKLDGSDLTKFEIDEGIGMLGHSTLLDSSLYIGSPKGILSFNLVHQGGFNLVEGSEIFSGQSVRVANNYKEGHILFGDWHNLLVDYDGDAFTPFRTEVDDYLRENLIYDFEVINDDLYAIATLSGGVVFINSKGQLQQMFTEKNGLATNQVYDLYFDDERVLWMGLQKGIQKLVLDENFIVYNEANGLNDLVTDFAVSGVDILVNTTFGLFKGEPTAPEQTIHFEELEIPEITSEVFSWRNSLYTLTGNGLFKVEKEGEFEKLINASELVKVKTQDESEKISFVNKEFLVHYYGDNNFQRIELPQINQPSNVLMKGDSLFILNSSSGLQLVVEDRVYEVPYADESVGINYHNEIGFINNEIFVGIEGENVENIFYRYDEKQNNLNPNHFLSAFSELRGNQVLTFEQCSETEIWFNANKKIIRAYKDSKEWRIDNSSYGLLHDNTSAETIFEINCEEDGVWFGGTEGLFHLKEPEFKYNTDFKTNITGIYINRDSLIYGGFGEAQQPIILPYQNNELRFSYAAASYIAPKRNKYQVKLEGFDTNWNTWTSETQKDYTNIPEGEYIFRVRSKNVYDVAGITDAISFEILPPWYRTWWAYLLYTFSIAGILYVAYKIRINQILRVQRIRNNIASDLHDEVSATLSSISYFAEAIESEKFKGDKNRFVKLIANSAGDAKEKITDIVWAINPEHDDWPNFLSKCRRFASDLLESKNIEYSLKIDEFIPGKLDMQLRQHLWLIYKEMITNAIRHSGATQLDIIIKYAEGRLSLIVQDNGKGMDVDSVRKGNGLVNIHKRAELIEAEISLKTSEGFGTRWVLNIPI